MHQFSKFTPVWKLVHLVGFIIKKKGKFTLSWTANKFTDTWSGTDAGIFMIYRRFGSRFSANVGAADHKVVDTSRVQSLLLLLRRYCR
jgi:hypothetical protein